MEDLWNRVKDVITMSKPSRLLSNNSCVVTNSRTICMERPDPPTLRYHQQLFREAWHTRQF